MDDRVASAIAHWAPRFTANGVTPADFARVTASVETWPEWCAAWVAVGEEHEELGREALKEGRLRSGGEHLAQAAAYYHFAKFVFVEDVDQMRAAHARAVAAYTDALPHLDPPGRRVEIPFEGAKLVAVVRTPYGEGPFPVVLMIPGLDSTKEEVRSTEQTFLDRGLATFSVDGPGQGEAEYDVKIRGDWGPVAEVLYEAIGEQPDLDRDRLGVWGVSLGGYYSVRVAAALGDRATAGVALAGPFNFGECWDGLPPLTRDTFRVRSGAADDDEARAVASTLDLTGTAGDVTAPMLLVFGKQDRLIPYQQAEKVHAAVPGSELLMLERANHGCADYSPWHRPRTADWLAAHLGGDPGDPGRILRNPREVRSLMSVSESNARHTPGSMTIGWIGAGRMGAAMASRLAGAGEDVLVWNRTRAKAEALTDSGCRVADAIADLRDRDVVFTMVSGPADLGQVLTGDDGLLTDPDHLPGAVVDCSTVDAETSEAMRQACTQRGVDFLSAPVSGNGKVVRAGLLTLVVSGPEETWLKVAPLLEHLGQGATYVGEGDAARLAKICHNVMLGVVTQCLAEITVLAEKGGMSRAAFLDFLNKSVMGSTFTRYKSPAFVHLDYSPTFTPVLLRKDFDLAFAAAHDLDVPMPVAAAAAAAVQATVSSGRVDEDFAILLDRQAHESGVVLKPEDVEVDDGLSGGGTS